MNVSYRDFRYPATLPRICNLNHQPRDLLQINGNGTG